MIMYLNVSINYLNNINCKFVMSFVYHENLPKRMRNLNNSLWNSKILVVEKKKKNHNTLYTSLNNIDHLKKEYYFCLLSQKKKKGIISIKCT